MRLANVAPGIPFVYLPLCTARTCAATVATALLPGGIIQNSVSERLAIKTSDEEIGLSSGRSCLSCPRSHPKNSKPLLFDCLASPGRHPGCRSLMDKHLARAEHPRRQSAMIKLYRMSALERRPANNHLSVGI